MDTREAIFQRWLDQHTGLMMKVTRAWTSTPEDRDDLLQQILLQLWTSIASFRQESKESTWVYRVAFNTALAWKRGEKRLRDGQESFLRYNVLPTAQASHLESNGNKELVDRLYAAIKRLPKLEASLALMYLEGISYKEIAEILGITESNVGVKINRLKKQLADQLRGESDGPR